MNQNVGTYISLPYELREKLEYSAKKTHREINRIIIEALKEYLFKINKNLLSEDARRQSLSVSRKSDPSDDVWENNIDF